MLEQFSTKSLRNDQPTSPCTCEEDAEAISNLCEDCQHTPCTCSEENEADEHNSWEYKSGDEDE